MVEFLNIVETEQPDVIAMQEYMGRGDTIRLTKRLEKMGYGHSASGYDDGHLSGEVIFSKLPIVRVVRIDGPSKFYAKLLLGDDTVSLFCLHLGSYKLDTSDKRQIYDLSHGNVDGQSGRGTLRKFRETILVHEKEWLSLKPYFEGNRHHTIVAGDFNETPASYFYSQCQKYFTDSYCEAGQGFSTTYHGTFTRQRAATFPAFRIDMVMHTPDLEALSYKRIKCNASDHYPVVVTMELKK